MPLSELNPAIKKAARLVKEKHLGVTLTGAGISTPSGIPDFRSEENGLWKRYDPKVVVSLSNFRYQPEVFFKWFRPLAHVIIEAKPNPAHIALAELESSGHLNTIITQNVDGLHQRAGSQQVLEVHGTLRTLTCIQCYKNYSAADFIEAFIEEGIIPHCPECEGILKPDTILYEEQLPVKTWIKAVTVCKKCDLMIIAGSSLEVLPVAGLPICALENGASMVMINKSPTYLDIRADVILRGDVAQILPEITAEVLRD
jgi:NAD-dependent deacetylase